MGKQEEIKDAWEATNAVESQEFSAQEQAAMYYYLAGIALQQEDNWLPALGQFARGMRFCPLSYRLWYQSDLLPSGLRSCIRRTVQSLVESSHSQTKTDHR